MPFCCAPIGRKYCNIKEKLQPEGLELPNHSVTQGIDRMTTMMDTDPLCDVFDPQLSTDECSVVVVLHVVPTPSGLVPGIRQSTELGQVDFFTS